MRAATNGCPAVLVSRLACRVHRSAGNKEADMANMITEDCINCAACESECPNEAISEGEDTYVIDASKCDECESNGGENACKAVCPSDSIVQA
ncbi:MAG: 4Fe-4S binding protein [Myxococcales bacterium]